MAASMSGENVENTEQEKKNTYKNTPSGNYI